MDSGLPVPQFVPLMVIVTMPSPDSVSVACTPSGSSALASVGKLTGVDALLRHGTVGIRCCEDGE